MYESTMGQTLVIYGSYIGHTYFLFTCAHYVTDLIIYLAAHWLELVHDSFVASENRSLDCRQLILNMFSFQIFCRRSSAVVGKAFHTADATATRRD